MLLFPSVKCTQYHILEVISPKMWFLFPSFSLFHSETYTLHMHACLCSLFIFVLSKHPAVSHLFLVSRWWKAPAVLSRNPSPPYVTDILPALFTSRMVIQSPLTVSTFVTWAGGKRGTRLCASMPLCNLSQRENGAIMLMTSSSLCISFILPMRSENTFQTAWNVFHPVTQLLCYDAVQKLLHKTNSSASMQDSLCTVIFFFWCFLVYFKDPVWTVWVISEIFLSVICSLVRGSVEKALWCCVFACTNQDWAIF